MKLDRIAFFYAAIWAGSVMLTAALVARVCSDCKAVVTVESTP